MLGKLNDAQIERLLKEQVVGRIACQSKDELYLVPINYVYRNGCIYAHSGEGKKIRMMRENPKVCFAVDDIKSVFNWKSVIAQGTFEEIIDMEEKQQAMQGIIHRIMPLVTKPEGHPSHGITENESDVGTNIELVIYRIRLGETSGRFESDE
ncbi:pyridoxamine 5'-phosphate oxidase family protein [Mucilaginibacter sp. KACC 22063]|uniref:pyridoxamine 5'-phosphate oxidase family protein n=1 Tax=Mucilaginibacter sp. KACC 22063 TaxID=3025666 RepID=UPI002365649A|nr:pyridoxamine 5'-phosphate oxidase family protein [Mucilaginibacter sp. KACC 22063]WDF55758.1 pyridoxamine 5'-phosphate oxidase family protein [Mucilaginibacter sp. KACC 22063]